MFIEEQMLTAADLAYCADRGYRGDWRDLGDKGDWGDWGNWVKYVCC